MMNCCHGMKERVCDFYDISIKKGKLKKYKTVPQYSTLYPKSKILNYSYNSIFKNLLILNILRQQYQYLQNHIYIYISFLLRWMRQGGTKAILPRETGCRKRPSEKLHPMAQTNRHTHTETQTQTTDGHCYLETELGQRVE